MSADSDTPWAAIGYVLASDYRQLVLDHLTTQPDTPSGIATASGHDISHISRAIAELRERDIVELLVPEDRHKGRVYGVTERGKRVAQRVEGER